MKNLNSYLSLSLVAAFLLMTSFSKNSSSMEEIKINSYLSSIESAVETDQVVVYSDLIIKEDGHFYKVDFLLDEEGRIELLNKEIETEYYIMEDFNTVNLVQYTFPIVSIVPETEYKA